MEVSVQLHTSATLPTAIRHRYSLSRRLELPQIRLDESEWRKISCLCRESKNDSSIAKPTSLTPYPRLSHPVLPVHKKARTERTGIFCSPRECRPNYLKGTIPSAIRVLGHIFTLL